MANKIEDLEEKVLLPENMPKSISDCLADIFLELGDGSKKHLGIETGVKSLDDATLGLSGLIVLSGKAGGGKTSLALQLATGACNNGVPAIIYSLEMSKRQVVVRLLSQLSGVDQKRIYRGGRYTEQKDSFEYSLNYDDYMKLEQAKEALKIVGQKFYILDRTDGQNSFETVKEQVKAIKAMHHTDSAFVVVDHLQVFPVDRSEKKNYFADQIGKESVLITQFKQVQEETGSTIMLISQQNKSQYNTGNITSVKGSVDIIYLADLVMQLTTDEKGMDDLGEIFEADQDIWLRISKNRYGETKSIKLRFDGSISLFREI